MRPDKFFSNFFIFINHLNEILLNSINKLTFVKLVKKVSQLVMNVKTKKFLKIILFPLYVVAVYIPRFLEYLVFLYYKKKIKIQKDQLFLINPKSGKKLGKKLIKIFHKMNYEDRVLDIIKTDYV